MPPRTRRPPVGGILSIDRAQIAWAAPKWCPHCGEGVLGEFLTTLNDRALRPGDRARLMCPKCEKDINFRVGTKVVLTIEPDRAKGGD